MDPLFSCPVCYLVYNKVRTCMVLSCGHSICESCLGRVEACPVCREEFLCPPQKNWLVQDLCGDKEDWQLELRVASGACEAIPESIEPFARLLVLRLRGCCVHDELTRLMLTQESADVLSWLAVLKLPPEEEREALQHMAREGQNIKFLKNYSAEFLLKYIPTI